MTKQEILEEYMESVLDINPMSIPALARKTIENDQGYSFIFNLENSKKLFGTELKDYIVFFNFLFMKICVKKEAYKIHLENMIEEGPYNYLEEYFAGRKNDTAGAVKYKITFNKE